MDALKAWLDQIDAVLVRLVEVLGDPNLWPSERAVRIRQIKQEWDDDRRHQ